MIGLRQAQEQHEQQTTHLTHALLLPTSPPHRRHAAFPASIAAATREARAAGAVSTFSTSMCNIMARPDVQGTREFRDLDGVKLWPMFINLARASYVRFLLQQCNTGVQ